MNFVDGFEQLRGRAVFEEDAGSSGFQRAQGAGTGHASRDHQDLSLEMHAGGGVEERGTLLMTEIEIQQDDVHSHGGERLDSFGGGGAGAGDEEIRLGLK